MQEIKKYIVKHWSILTILAFGVLISWPLFMPGYFFHHDDIQVLRIFEMRKCFEDLQIPCRWVPDMGYGYGYPLFNYYSALPYYIGGVLSYFLGFVGASKAVFFVFLMLGGVSMYLLGKSLWGNTAGLLAGILYSLAPYRALDAYVRGAVAESFALALIPLVLYFIRLLILTPTRFNFLGVSLSLGAFLLSHNIMTMIFSPLIIFWVIYWIFKVKNPKLVKIFSSLLLGFGIAAFFLVPAFFEKNLVQTESLTSEGFRFWIHFVSLFQLFLDRSWGFGASVFGVGDTISFQIGWPHWWIVVALVILISYKFIKERKTIEKTNLQLGIFLIFFFLFSIFMTHNKSTAIWSSISTLQYAQFPWRFLGLTIFSASLLGGLFLFLLNKKWQKAFLVILITITVIFNFAYFNPADIYPDADDNKKLSGNDWEFQRKASIKDYLPKTATEPMTAAPDSPQIRSGNGHISEFKNRSSYWNFKTELDRKSEIEVPVFDFPNWKVYANGNLISHQYTRQGSIKIILEKGSYVIQGKFTNTPLRTLANIISFGSILILILVSSKNKLSKKLWI